MMRDERVIHLDRTGFPMLWLASSRAYLHIVPVTKVQLELFLTDARDGHFNKRWYEEVLSLNPRKTARDLVSKNYWSAFATGVLPEEAERYASWCGEGYRLPTEQEWFAAFGELDSLTREVLLQNLSKVDLSPRAADLLKYLRWALEDVASLQNRPATGALLTAMRFGALEWVTRESQRPGRFAALGEPNPGFFGNLLAPERGEIVPVVDPKPHRHKSYGFRLVYQPKSEQAPA